MIVINTIIMQSPQAAAPPKIRRTICVPTVFRLCSDCVAYGQFSEFQVCFLGPRPWHIEIRHRVKNTSTINLCGFETLKLKIRRLKLWKPTVRLGRVVFRAT